MSYNAEATAHPQSGDATSVPITTADISVPTDPAEAAKIVAAAYGSTIMSYLHFAKAVFDCTQIFTTASDLGRFAGVLADHRILSARDAMAPSRANGKLSMIKKIGQHFDVLSSPSIINYIDAEYSKLYQIVLVLEMVEHDLTKFSEALARLEPDYTRDDVIELKQQLEAGHAQSSLLDGRLLADPAMPADNREPECGGDTYPSADLIMVTCGPRDAHRLRRDAADVFELDRALARPVLTDDAVVVVFARLRDVGIIETRLLPHLGLDRISHVFRFDEIQRADVIDCEIAIVAERGTNVQCPIVPLSPTMARHAIAMQLCPRAKRKFQMFAPSNQAGWISLGWQDSEVS